jgi:tripartite-type tricarboxylate transporter receptor subunit TctC
MKRILSASLGVLVALAAVLAQAYPTRPIRMVVPFAAGGPSDAAARAVGKTLSRALAQPIVIDNRPGANGAIAAQTVFSAAPDGHTLLWAVGSMVAIPLLQKSATFDSLASFSPAAMTGQFAFGVFIHPGIPAKTVEEFVRYARASGAQLVYASATLGEYLAAVHFIKATGVSMLRVPYKGSAQVLPDLIAGRVQVYFGPVGAALPYTNDGRVRILATLLSERNGALPHVPTMAESGIPGVMVPSWQAIFGPPKTPAAIVARVSQQTNLALKDAELRQQFDKLLLQPQGSSPERLAAVVTRDFEMWRVFIRENDIPVE